MHKHALVNQQIQRFREKLPIGQIASDTIPRQPEILGSIIGDQTQLYQKGQVEQKRPEEASSLTRKIQFIKVQRKQRSLNLTVVNGDLSLETATSNSFCLVQLGSKNNKYKNFGALLQPIHIENSNIEPFVFHNGNSERLRSSSQNKILRKTRPTLTLD